MARANSPLNLSLRRDLAAKVPDRVAVLGQTVSGWMAILVWNDSLRPNPKIAALVNDTPEIRVDIGCSLRAPLRAMATTQARKAGLSRNASLEALVAADLANPRSDLVVYSRI